MRFLTLSIFAIGLFLGDQVAAQTYDPAYPVCLHVYGRANYADTRRCPSVTRPRRAARHSATSTPILQARRGPGEDIPDGSAASTRFFA